MSENVSVKSSVDKVYTGKPQKKSIYLVLLVVPLITAVVLGYFIVSSGYQSESVVLVVGQEKIYKKDLDFEESVFPDKYDKTELRKNVLSKMAEDSVILQAASQDGIIQLDSKIFDSPSKDYSQRLNKIAEIKKVVSEKAANVSGEIITVWFYNNEPSEFGYEKGKSIAKTKIDEIHKEVTGKKLTMLQAKAKLLADPDVRKLDPSAYLSNVYMEFRNVQAGQKITADKTFDTLLFNTKVNEYTPVVSIRGKSRGTDGEIELLYAFGYIYSKNTSQDSQTLEEWISTNRSKFIIK
jgi:hypothetical protein